MYSQTFAEQIVRMRKSRRTRSNASSVHSETESYFGRIAWPMYPGVSTRTLDE
jgi:hypothetical protein